MKDPSMRDRSRSRGQSAVLDRGTATLLTAVAIVAVIGSWLVFTGSGLIADEQNQIAALDAAVEQMFDGQPSYAGLSTGGMASSGALPTSWVVGTGVNSGIVSAYRSVITLGPVTNAVTGLVDGAWTLTLSGLPAAGCVALATRPVSAHEYGVSINGVGAPGGTAAAGTNPLPTPAQAAAACALGANTLVFYIS